MDDPFPEPPSYHGTAFCEFKLVTTKELSGLIRTSGRNSCALDPIPASVLRGCLDLLLPFITRVVNFSPEHGVMARDMKEASLKPVLKKASLDNELFKNYRPVSNLMFLSKFCK